MNTSTKIATLNSLPANNNSQCGLLKLNIHTTTGGHIEINMSEKETVSSLKWRLSRKLRITSEKMSLLFKDRPLKEGSLQDNLVTDNSKILLLPNMESGITFQRPDVGVIQGLENLTESQVNDFLSGRAPLLLVMKLGDHMMFVQLQLSTASCSQSAQTNRSQCTVDAKEKAASTGPVFNSAALAELGHNLSQKLREFSQLSTHQKVPEHCPTGNTTASAAGSANSTSAYSVSKTGTANGSVTHTQPSIPANNNNNNNNNNSNNSNNSSSNIGNSNNTTTTNNNHNNQCHSPNNTNMTSSSSCNPSIPCNTSSAPTPVSRTCPTTGEPIPGAIIESMHHVGQGVYSGTFSGTLDPSLQDMDGKPKRNIGTIIHILNDLLGATPQYRAQNVPHTAEKPMVDSCSHKNGEQTQLPVGLSEEDNALRGKVKDLQMKMEEKRMRRQARREAKAPYQFPGPRPHTTLTNPESTTTITTFASTANTDHISSLGTCSMDSELSVFGPQHPECTLTEMEIGGDSVPDGDGKNREIEMTAVPTPATTTATSSSTAASTKATEPSAYANTGLEQESVLV